MTSEAVDDLRAFLDTQSAGVISDENELASLSKLLATAWDEFEGALECGMQGRKLLDRMESVSWNPPFLTFRIERHGAIVCGSSRAELQYWGIDLDALSASVSTDGYRQVYKRDKPLKVEPLVKKVVEVISAGKRDARLKWTPDQKQVTVLIGELIPAEGPKETVRGRRRRFAKELAKAMQEAGWDKVSGTSPHTFRRRQ